MIQSRLKLNLGWQQRLGLVLGLGLKTSDKILGLEKRLSLGLGVRLEFCS